MNERMNEKKYIFCIHPNELALALATLSCHLAIELGFKVSQSLTDYLLIDLIFEIVYIIEKSAIVVCQRKHWSRN